MKSTVIDKWTWKRNGPKSTECSNSSSKRGIYSDTVKLQETRKIWNKQPKLILEELGGKNKDQSQWRQEIIKLRMEINEIETKKPQKRSIKLRADSLKR